MAEVKLKDIAGTLGVSVVTVSNALSGKAGVSDKLRSDILSKAKEFGYDCGRYERQQDVRIGVLVSEKYVSVGDSFYWEMYQHVAYAASKRQSATMIEILENDGPVENLPRMLGERTSDGILVIGWMSHDYIKMLIDNIRVPIVLLDFQYSDLPCDAVISANYIGGYKITKYLLERGHRRIGFVGSVRANENIMDRYFGYRKGLAEYGIPLRQDWILEDRVIETGDMLHIELPGELPEAFVCNSDLAASKLYDALQEKGMRVPEDVSVIAYDNYLHGHKFAGELTTYNVDMKRMAEDAVKTLLSKIRGNEKHFGVRTVDSVIVERESVKQLQI